MMNRARSVLLFALLALCGRILSAQTLPNTSTPPFGSFGGGPDAINLANLNSHIVVPVLHKSGRGTDFTYDLSYDTYIWYPVGAVGSQTWKAVPNWGWRAITEVAVGYISFDQTGPVSTCNGMGMKTTYSNWTYHDNLGVEHWFGPNAVSTVTMGSAACQGSTGFTLTAADGSGYTLVVNGSTVSSLTSASGSKIQAPANTGTGAGSFTDRNGNVLSANSSGQFFDTMSSTVPVLTAAGAGTAASPITYTYTAPNASSVHYTMNFTNFTVATNFLVSGVGEYRSPAAVPLVTSIALPDGSQYTFHYEATPGSCTPIAGTTCTTARLTSVTLPTGGTISYSYTGGNNGILKDGSTATLTRTTPDGVWTYAQVKGTTAPASTTTVTDPASNVTTISFQGIYETQRFINQGSSTALRTITTCYNGTPLPCSSASTTTAIIPPITIRSVIDAYGIGTAGEPFCKHDYFYNSFGLPTMQDDYDYPSATAMLRRQVITYASLGNNITSMPATTTLCDPSSGTAAACNGTGTVVGQTTVTYDQTTPSATPVASPHHNSVTGSRGNPTTIASLVQGTTTLSRTIAYWDTGNVKTATDVNGAQTTYNYPDATNTCGNAFPTSVTEPLSLSRSMTWNCTGGVQLTNLDENSKTTTTAYSDAFFWRPASVTDPAGAVINFCYGLLSGGTCTRNSTQSEVTLPINLGASASDLLTTVDGLGRVKLQQTRQSPTSANFDTTEQIYNNVGLPSRTMLPYVGTAGQANTTGANVTTTYDALGRPLSIQDSATGITSYFYNGTNSNKQNDVLVTIGPAPTGENTKRRQLEYDALGRLKSVCELTTAAGSATCGQAVGQTGYWTKYTYNAAGNLTGVTQNAQAAVANQQTRSYSYDFLGRLISETNPESGTTSYTWDSASVGVCAATSKGDLIVRTNATGFSACSTYDALHRPLSIGHNPARAGNTPDRFFTYDAATVNGAVMANAKGRLAEAYTCGSPCTKITDLGFSYTGRGQISDEYQTSPNSGGFYHENLTYWENGATRQISGLASLPTFTYGLDGEGRINSISASTGQNPLTSVVYNPASLPSTINLGSGDSDVYTHDANTERILHYTFNINGQAFVGSPTWNPNGSLGSLTITDPFNTADTQNCTYSHDDLARIASANCGTAASQTFTFDAFGNISKSGSPNSFLPTYTSNPPTNRVASTSGFSYDADGNVLNDGLLTRTFDADDFQVTGNGTSVTIDALGRRIDSGFLTATFYSPDGLLRVAYKTQVARLANLVLPGGGSAIYDEGNGGLIEYNHSDNLGSIRLVSTPSRTFARSKAFAPFGEVYAASVSAGSYFTGQGNFFNLDTYEFPAREYVDQGRWASADPAGLAAVNPAFPQSWNRYAYVLNNPLSYVDPTGLTCYIQVVDENGFYHASEIPGVNEKECPGTWIDSVGTTVQVNGGNGGNDGSGLPPGGCASFYQDGVYIGNVCGGPTASGGGGGGGQKKPSTPPQESFADCIKNDGDYFSLQNGLRAITGGKLGNGWLAGTFLGNPVSSGIQAVQDFRSGNFWSSANNTSQTGASFGVTPLANRVPNLAFSATVGGTIALDTPGFAAAGSAFVKIAGAIPFGSLARTIADKLDVLGYAATIPVSAATTSFSAVVCSIGR
jgi:RHS repeat-associated protein